MALDKKEFPGKIEDDDDDDDDAEEEGTLLLLLLPLVPIELES